MIPVGLKNLSSVLAAHELVLAAHESVLAAHESVLVAHESVLVPVAHDCNPAIGGLGLGMYVACPLYNNDLILYILLNQSTL